jgi:hypothetical protein
MRLLTRLLLAIFLTTTAYAQSAPLSERIVAYQIEAKLDPAGKTLDATQTLTYRNLTGQPLNTFPFHLYLNAFQPKSTFMREVRRDNPKFKWEDKWYGSAEIKSLEVVGMGDLTAHIKFVQPDDANADDRTVFEVKLPRPVPPGAEVQFKIAFHNKFPEVFARTGYKRDFFLGAQWFPKIGVFWHGAWNCHQFHRNTEFFADFGTYDVKLTLPQRFVVGATGVQTASVNNADGSKTLSFHAVDVHDFAWTADPNFKVVEDTFTGSAGPVQIRLLMQPGHMDQAGRHMQALKGTMERFDQWIGPYPYPQITVVDPTHGGFRAGGMEYPMLIAVGTAWWMPDGLRFPELVVEHEFGHQYFYGMVASNEFEEAWLDEGINSYIEVKIMDSMYGPKTSGLSTRLGTLGERGYQRAAYLGAADLDPIARPAWQFINYSTYGAITYNKTATVLLTLERFIGEDTLMRALRTYFVRYRFTHPTREDFFKTLQEVSGQDLRWYIEQAILGTAMLDYDIRNISSDRLDWFEKKKPEEKKGETVYRSTVTVHREGEFVAPVEITIKFDNGDLVRERWDGRDRWTRFTYERKAKVISAEIDPDHKVWLDKDFYNNSRLAEEQSGARRKLAAYWMIFVQFLAQILAWLT